MPNKQIRGDYKNAPNTQVPSPPVPKLQGGQQVKVPPAQQTPHPFKQNKL